MSDWPIKRAWADVALAGRQLGSGPARVLEEPEFSELVDELYSLGIPFDRAQLFALGVVVGLRAASDPIALRALSRIENDWQKEH